MHHRHAEYSQKVPVMHKPIRSDYVIIYFILNLSFTHYMRYQYFFQDSRLPLETQTMIFYFFSIDLQLYQVEKMLPDIAHSTLVNYYQMLRQLCRQHWSSMKMVGNVEGFHNIIEIDESLFGKKQKYNRGRPTKKQWVFGLVERTSRKTHFRCVSDRKQDTLLPIIQSHVQQGATIYHDDWAAYRDLQFMGYEHGTVVHKYEFVSKDGVCTNTIEGKYITIFTYTCHQYVLQISHMVTVMSNFNSYKKNIYTRK